ncbi:DUF697 domain-containing protein [Paramagnetospirillum magnetotacticum]|uniref:DUF697 domain-containing protein n=1 Tax=Paramagnetospirillum magnetotacticum TaxID=188 RepID=UPI001364B5E2|nr:DUF697 domain-containing protein [Paramagnetospirillum magnetotacticum]
MSSLMCQIRACWFSVTFRRILRELTIVAAADAVGNALTTALAEALGKGLETVTVAAAEGTVAGQRMVRLGLVAIAVCRPLPFDEATTPNMLDILFADTKGGC